MSKFPDWVVKATEDITTLIYDRYTNEGISNGEIAQIIQNHSQKAMNTTSFEHKYGVGDDVYAVYLYEREGYKFFHATKATTIINLKYSVVEVNLIYVTTFNRYSESDLFPTREAAEAEAERRNEK